MSKPVPPRHAARLASELRLYADAVEERKRPLGLADVMHDAATELDDLLELLEQAEVDTERKVTTEMRERVESLAEDAAVLSLALFMAATAAHEFGSHGGDIERCNHHPCDLSIVKRVVAEKRAAAMPELQALIAEFGNGEPDDRDR